jgi:hypothetical protein
MPECPGCGATVAEEGEICQRYLDTALELLLNAEEENDKEETES